MAGDRKALAAELVEVAVSLAAVWYTLPAHTRQHIHAQAWYHVARQARRIAAGVGGLALTAEQRYWKAVQS